MSVSLFVYANIHFIFRLHSPYILLLGRDGLINLHNMMHSLQLLGTRVKEGMSVWKVLEKWLSFTLYSAIMTIHLRILFAESELIVNCNVYFIS